MFFIFGWEKESKILGDVLKTDCFNCQNHTQWQIWKETEWVSLFFIKVLPFINKGYIGCSKCGDSAEISINETKQALSPARRTQDLYNSIIKKIEDHQFSGLTEGQISYRKAQFERKKNA